MPDSHSFRHDEPPRELAPDMLRFQQMLAAGYAAHPALDSVSLAQARRIVEQVREPLTRGGPRMLATHALTIDAAPLGPLRLRVHVPQAAKALPALVYLHGGGWVYFNLDTHDRLMREYAARSGRVVVGVEYAHAPEARFPVALHQCVAALRWLRAHAQDHGVDAHRIALAGDSAGANLALAAALELRDAGAGELLESLVLNYGAYSDDEAGESFRRYDGPRYSLGSEEMRGFWRHYLRSDADRLDPRAQPLRASLAGLPPCLLVVAECDVLRDGNLALATKLREASVPVSLLRYEGACHSFLEAMSFSPLSNCALDDTCAWLHAPGQGGPWL